ncbi:MAG: DNA repair protein RadA [Candidatus Kapabacteria bacterium]|nr:DNA repair protein RadA [Candidatus Kapabacteria bacterium]MCS7169145.1 DNA repair protein RadA [Candidatus Kapabacteria bacterium]MDW7996947.1 DNA repair protein RadA [Bacteroidota bacterium]MDW8224856.1 DNA repair protein RadA [Bacteroidota bacterium]
MYICQNCGATSARWIGRCPVCGEWGTFAEERQERNGNRSDRPGTPSPQPIALSEVDAHVIERIRTGIGEIDRVTGGGFVPGSLVLLTGDPGIGKSTLLLQVCAHLTHSSPLYISGEESLEQLRLRACRLKPSPQNLLVLAETELESVENAITRSPTPVVIVDSVQTLYSSELESPAGSVTQVREAAARLQRIAKQTGKVIVLVGHVTKEGMIAGPKVLEHVVDTVLQFDGEVPYAYRVLRALKNRFGPTDELGFFEMTAEGLRELSNPSALFLSEGTVSESGVTIAVVLQGTRPLLVEVQALVTPSSYTVPQRSITGYDYRRLQMIMAVLERRLGIGLRQYDLFANVVGGLRLEDPALDAALALAIVSSHRDRSLPPSTAVFGELGLTGELRPVRLPELRVREAQRLGIRRLVLPKSSAEAFSGSIPNIDLVAVDRLSLALTHLFP